MTTGLCEGLLFSFKPFWPAFDSRLTESMGNTFSGLTNEPYLGLQAKYRWPLTEPSFFPGLTEGGRKKHTFYRRNSFNNTVVLLQIKMLGHWSRHELCKMFESWRNYVTVSLLKKFRLDISSSSFVIRVNLLHPLSSLFLYGLLSSLWCCIILGNYHFQVSFSLKEILNVAKITQNTVTKLLKPLNSLNSLDLK